MPQILLPGVSFLLLIFGLLYLTYITSQRIKLFRLESQFRSQFQGKNFPLALTTISKALELDPYSINLYQIRARLYFEMGDYFSARADYSRALRFTQSAPVFAGMAAVQIALGEGSEALLNANHAIACNHLWWRGYFERARAYLLLGHFKVALGDLEIAFELNPTPPSEFYLARSEAFHKVRQPEQALKDQELASILQPLALQTP